MPCCCIQAGALPIDVAVAWCIPPWGVATGVSHLLLYASTHVMTASYCTVVRRMGMWTAATDGPSACCACCSVSAAFLSGLGVMDYSLLVGFDKQGQELVVGVIDFIRQVWAWQPVGWLTSAC